jgi:UDP-N-acetylglucosamine diphosphorylase / glucose-1-phosphate thymidylyltransferase / UDP-N-acetylgalactosamine diphosphorylase / glucosamine-1-phosphate N-acetyltransferase / galactosamine-1-phosphate N-acetyltransferase
MLMFKPETFFSLTDWEEKALFDNINQVWEILPKIKSYIRSGKLPSLSEFFPGEHFITRLTVLYRGELLAEGVKAIPGDATKGKFQVFYKNQELQGATIFYGGVTLSGEDIFIGEGTVVETGAFIQGPALIGRQTEVRQGAYLRGGCLVGDRCVVGHVTEMKNSVMLPGAKAGHFAYIGDSILGRDCNLGAGTKLANLKLIRGNIKIKGTDQIYDTGLRKFGAVLGDGTETGCNSVTSPGTLLSPRCLVAPNVTVGGGFYTPKSIIR